MQISKCLVFTVLLSSLLGCQAVFAQHPLGLPDNTFSYQEYPDIPLLAHPPVFNAMFPNYDARALEVDYSEYHLAGSDAVALVSCTAAGSGFIAVLHYGPDGLCRLQVNGLPIKQDQLAVYTFRLPTGDGGVTRVLHSNTLPEHSLLVQLARHPNDTSVELPGIITQRWLKQGSSATSVLPWSDPFRPQQPADIPIHARSSWPAAMARLDETGRLITKDCGVEFDGLSVSDYDIYGPYGQWQLDWAAELRLLFELPAADNRAEVDLRIICSDSNGAAISSWPPLELEINDWPLSEADITNSFGSGNEPFSFSLSQNIQAGSNEVALRLDPLAESQWLIRRLEVWVY
jgi:hypothetical protein